MENLNEKQQIEEMARVLCEDCERDVAPCSLAKSERMCDSVREQAEVLYTAGYRKQSEGEWAEKAKCGVSIKGYMVCSVCDVMIPACDADGDYYCLSRLDYCPRCGAKMKNTEN